MYYMRGRCTGPERKNLAAEGQISVYHALVGGEHERGAVGPRRVFHDHVS